MKILPKKSDFRSIVNVNLFLTRQITTGIILFLSVFCFLLPASVITYFSFRKSIIPVDRIQSPINFLDPMDRPFKKREIDTTGIYPYLERNKNLTFAVNLNLHGICKIETSHQVFSYSMKLPAVSNQYMKKIHEDSVLVNCDSRYIYAKKNRLVPYNLRYWAPPIAVNVMKSVDLDHQMLTMKGYELQHILNQGKPEITLLNMNFLFLDPHKSSVDFVVMWEGFRFYLVHYYFTSLVIGTVIFWVPSSISCIFFAFLVSVYLKTGEEYADTVSIKQE